MRITKTLSLVVLLMIFLSSAAFALPDRLVIEVSDPLADELRSEGFTLSTVNGLENLDIGLKPLFYEPKDADKRRVWYDLGMNRWFRVTGQDQSLKVLTNNALLGKDIYSYEVIKPDRKTLIPDDHTNFSMWGLDRMMLPEAWEIHQQHDPSPIKITTIDTGTKISHPDLAGNIYVNPGEDLNGNGIWDESDIDGIDNDANGFIDDISGWDFVDYEPTEAEMAVGEDYFPRDNEVFPDIDGHGTHVAGTAAAVTNNNVGVSAASWNVTSMPLRAGFAWINPEDGNQYGVGYGDDFAAAIQYAVDNGSRVISISFGGTGYYEPYNVAINYARANDVILFASAGNEAYSTLTYPAAYDGAIAVAATTTGDAKASFSNFGDWIGISAPGTNIWSTMSNSIYAPGDYASYQGTSMACPNTAAVAALILSYDPTLSDDDLEALIYDTADDINPQNPGYIDQLGAGLINAEAALTAISGGPGPSVYIPDGTFGGGQYPQVMADGLADVGGLELHIEYNGGVFQVTNVILNTAIANATINIEPGMVHIIWAGIPESLTLPDGSILATLQGNLIGGGGETMFDFTEGSILSDLDGYEYPVDFFGGFWEGYGDIAEVYIPDGTFATGMPQLFVDGFENVAGIEFHIGYNPTIFEVLNVTLHPDIADATVNVSDGFIHIIWAGIPQLLNIPDETLLATFEGIVLSGGSTPFEFMPGTMLSDEFGNPYPASYDGGMWEGTGGGAVVSIPSGNFDSGMMPEVLVDGIVNVAGIELHVEYDNTVFEVLEVVLHPDISDVIVNVMDGVIHIIWAGIPNTITLPHHTVLASFVGSVVGEGGVTNFTFLPNSMMSNAIGEIFPAHYIGGVWGGTGTGDFAVLQIPDGDFSTDIPPRIETTGFENVAGMELHIGYDQEVYTVVGIGLHPNITNATVNITDDMIHIIWAGIPNTVTIPDGEWLATFDGYVTDEGGPMHFDFAPNSMLANEMGEPFPALFIGGFWDGGPGPNEPPNSFDLLAPEPGYGTDLFEVMLEWEEAFDPNGDEVFYNIYVDTDPIIPTNPGSPMNDAPHDTPEFLATFDQNGTYFWRIEAFDDRGGTTWSTQNNWYFIVEADLPPDEFDLIAPEDMTEITYEQNVFDEEYIWQSALDPDNDEVLYNLNLWVTCDDPVLDTHIVVENLPDTLYTYSVPDSLIDGIILWFSPIEIVWNVEAHSNGLQTWGGGGIPFNLTLMPHTSSVDELYGVIPTEHSIARLYPNPFNPSINVVIAMPETENLRIDVIDVMGRHVDTIYNNVAQAGHQSYVWRAKGPSGIYFLRASTQNGWQEVRKIMFVK